MISTPPLLTDDEIINLGRQIAADWSCHSGTRIDPVTGIMRAMSNIEMLSLVRYREWRRQHDADSYD